MSGYYNQSEPDDEIVGSSGGGLRKQLEEVLAENKRLLERLNKQDAKDTASLLKDKGLDPAIAELIPPDTDPAQWVEKYAHLLGVPQNTPDPTPAAEPEAQLADDSDDALVLERQALAAMQDAQESGSSPVFSDAMERLGKVNSEAELMALIHESQKQTGM